MRRSFKGLNIKEMVEEAQKMTWLPRLPCTVEGRWEAIKENISILTDKFAPLKLVKDRRPPPWRSRAKKALQRKQKAWERLRTSGGHKRWLEYRVARKNANNVRKSCRYEFESKLAERAKNNPKAYFSYAQSKKAMRSTVGYVRSPEGTLSSNKGEVADLLVDHFEKVHREDTGETPIGRPNIQNTLPEMSIVFTANDLSDDGEIGRGAFGFVNRMLHLPTKSMMAVKRIRSTLNESEQTKTLKDLDVVMNSANCPHIVQFYGALFEEGDCWICMEMMATSLDKFYKFVYHHLLSRIPESILAQIAIATISALDYLKVELKVIHRDVKPSNILIDVLGHIKLCDFGISGQLVDSIAKSHDAGCRPYMAPERIHPNLSINGYDVRSDVWSFGISMIELATGQFPYPSWNSVFEQLTCVLNGDPPTLPPHNPNGRDTHVSCGGSATIGAVASSSTDTFSPEFRDFVAQCLQKDPNSRPKYAALRNHPFYRHWIKEKVAVGGYFSSVLDKVPSSMNLNELLDNNNM